MIWEIRLEALIPYAIRKWSKRPGKDDRERTVWSTHFAHFWPLPSQGCWMSLALADQYKCPTRLPFGELPSVIMRHHKTAEQARHLFCTGHVIHSHEHTVQFQCKEENVWTEKAERQSSECSYRPEDPRHTPKMIAYGEQCRIRDVWRRFSVSTRDQAWSLKSFCVANFY